MDIDSDNYHSPKLLIDIKDTMLDLYMMSNFKDKVHNFEFIYLGMLEDYKLIHSYWMKDNHKYKFGNFGSLNMSCKGSCIIYINHLKENSHLGNLKNMKTIDSSKKLENTKYNVYYLSKLNNSQDIFDKNY